MTTIIYTPALEGLDRKERSVDISDYRLICERRKSIFEKLPDDVPLKLYLDFDLKEKHCNEGHIFEDITPELIEIAKTHIRAELDSLGSKRTPQFAVKTATDIDRKIISFHLICASHKMTKTEQKVFFENVERMIENDTENNWRRDYVDVKPDTRFIDFSVYGRNRFLRSALSTKPLEDRYFEITEGTFEDTVISHDNHNAERIEIKIPERGILKSTCSVSGDEAEEINAYLDAGFFVKLASDYKSWTEMGFAIFGACGKKGYPLFDKFSKLCPSKYDRFECQEWFERLTPRNDGRGMGSIKYLAKLENPVEYEKIHKFFYDKKYPVKSLIETLFKNRPLILDSDETKFAKFIYEIVREDVLLIGDLYYIYFQNEWKMESKKSGDIVKNVLSNVMQEYDAYCISSLAKMVEELTNDKSLSTKELSEKSGEITKLEIMQKKQAKKIGSSAFINNVYAIFRSILSTKTQDIVFDNGQNNDMLFHFKNGVYDFQIRQFRDRLKTDYATQYLPYDYVPANKISPEKMKIVQDFFYKLQPIKEQRDFTLSYLAYCMTGITDLQIFKMNVGVGSNGKSTEAKVHSACFPTYSQKITSSIFKLDNQKRHKTLAEFVTKPIRFAYSEELPKTQLDNDFVKDWVDGGEMPVEVMFGTKIMMRVVSKLLTCSNHFLKFDSDGGIKRRGTIQHYNSRFVKEHEQDCPSEHVYRIDRTLELQFQQDNELKNAYFHLLEKYVLGKPIIPQEANDEFQEITDDNDDTINLIYNYFEITKEAGDHVSKKLIMDFVGEKYSDVAAKLKMLGCTYIKDARPGGRASNGGSKGEWRGIKRIENDIPTDN